MQAHPTVTMAQLQIGLYVVLDLSWFEHPFAFSHFKIKSEEQIKILRSLGLQTVAYNPALSDVSPGAPGALPATPPPAAEAKANISPALEAKRAMVQRIKGQRETAERIEQAFINTAKTIRGIEKNLFTQPAETLRQAGQLITQIADSILCAPDLAINIMGDKLGGEELYFHSMNVTMLSMMMARDIKLPQEVFCTLGMGALFHDIGRKDIPAKILTKTEPLTQAERHLYEMHCQYGVAIGQSLHFAPAVQAIIGEHHELFDGTGYPKKLKGESVGLLSRIVAIANYYDELCNPADIASALTPHEALSMMFAKSRNKFDPKLLQVFIRCLGVYPPGTIVQLSNGVIGMIATVNTARPTMPVVMIYDAQIPRDEALLVDLGNESDLNIAKAIKPAQVPGEIYSYLSPRKRVSYYFDAGKPKPETASP